MARPVTLTHDNVAEAADAISGGATLKSVAAGLSVTTHGLRKAATRCGINLQTGSSTPQTRNSVDAAEAAIEALYKDLQYVSPTAAAIARQALGLIRGVEPALLQDLKARL
jgi:hypothetical protein